MPSATITYEMPVLSLRVFDLLHDYGRRLEWDTLLKEARLTKGHEHAAKGATSLCVGKFLFGLVGIETQYLTFLRGQVAAVCMINRPVMFQSFAASIRHEDIGERSRVTYKLHFRLRAMCRLLEPVVHTYLKIETRRRLRALAEYLESREH